VKATEMETEAPCYTWRRTSGAAPDAVKAARPVLNGGREETCRKVTRLAPTQRRGTGAQTRHVCLHRATSRSLRKGLMCSESARRALCASAAAREHKAHPTLTSQCWRLSRVFFAARHWYLRL